MTKASIPNAKDNIDRGGKWTLLEGTTTVGATALNVPFTIFDSQTDGSKASAIWDIRKPEVTLFDIGDATPTLFDQSANIVASTILYLWVERAWDGTNYTAVGSKQGYTQGTIDETLVTNSGSALFDDLGIEKRPFRIRGMFSITSTGDIVVPWQMGIRVVG